MDYRKEIAKLRDDLSRASGKEYVDVMKKIGAVLVSAKLDGQDFEVILEDGLSAISQYAGSHEDLEVLEGVLDDLYDQGIIDEKRYDATVRSSPCGRWL